MFILTSGQGPRIAREKSAHRPWFLWWRQSLMIYYRVKNALLYIFSDFPQSKLFCKKFSIKLPLSATIICFVVGCCVGTSFWYKCWARPNCGPANLMMSYHVVSLNVMVSEGVCTKIGRSVHKNKSHCSAPAANCPNIFFSTVGNPATYYCA